MLDFAHVDIVIKHTEKRNHAFEIIKNELKIGQYDGIIAISGDGIIHEIVNGIMSRPDKDKFLKSITLGFIPAGTSNALVTSILEETNEINGVLTSAFKICKGKSRKMDLVEL